MAASTNDDTDRGSRNESTIGVDDEVREACAKLKRSDELMGDVVRKGLDLLAEKEPDRLDVDL